ncbi:hypothetical protein DFP72DRAFT_1047232 [Ephemerocybe angulata]|uniref:Tyrosinase copper-binding domain-containing protein n=1 Tax=Ephemerocybe angulata TaxID=980116 RepID=A0A8H6M523_9AGAR|nr:hypothetical protein DFP72DRAFT_1047232 [Tulosesus angulatus]
MPRYILCVYLLATLAIVSSLAAPAVNNEEKGPAAPGRRCSTIDRRREWRRLTLKERLSYIKSVHCLHKLPPRVKTGSATNRHEEFQLTHVALTPRIHFVGQFYPWHRHFVTLYSKALREECGYRGPTPYWNWSIDAEANVPLLESPLFDPVTGFGGNGVSGTYTPPTDPEAEIIIFPDALPLEEMWKGCVQSGPFNDTSFHLNVGPGRMITSHCLVRGMDPRRLPELSKANVQRSLDAKSFEDLRLIGEGLGGIHNAGHALVGGEMLNLYSSPGDPIFYLHHAGLDWVWWKWQKADPVARLTNISGPTTQDGTTQVTLDFPLEYPACGVNITIRDVMDSSREPSCYTYE